MKAFKLVLGVGLLVAVLWGCADRVGPREVLLNTPAQHASNGFKFLEAEKIRDAEREFRAALFVNENYAGAWVGLALVSSREGRPEEAWKNLAKAESLARENWEMVQVATARMELFMAQAQPGWLTRVEAAYTRVTGISGQSPWATYVLALAYLKSYKFPEAQIRFKEVASQGSSYSFLAQEGYSLCRMVIQAEPRSDIGRKSALIRTINRAELAALVVAEVAYPWPPSPSTPLAEDISAANIPYFESINQLLATDFPALRRSPQNNFWPLRIVRRQDLAEVAVAVVRLVSGRPTPKPSPFPPEISDLPREGGSLQAVILAVEWGLMRPVIRGVFDPWAPVPGAMALSVVRQAEKLGQAWKEVRP